MAQSDKDPNEKIAAVNAHCHRETITIKWRKSDIIPK
jgi:hypothetical protein